jgi:hypothetical protein
MKKLNLSLVITTSFLLSCNNEHATNDSSQKNDSVLNTTTSSITNTSDSTHKDFILFWGKFRTAVINNDSAQLILLSDFPIQTRGPLDNDPVIEYSRQKFTFVFNAFLNQFSGEWSGKDNDSGKTEFDVIKNWGIPNRKDIMAEQARIGDMIFFKIDGKWKLSFLYLEYDTIKSLKKE